MSAKADDFVGCDFTSLWSLMNWITLAFGVFALGYGLYTIYARLKTPDKFGKLEAMRQSYGFKAGTIVHTISYTIVPLVCGVLAIWAGIKGVSLFG